MDNLSKSLIEDASKCVKCGVCLPHCPTYNHFKNEAKSPRGRISLVQAVVEDKIPLNGNLQDNLFSCLSCGACEAACPSNVEFIKILDDSKSLIKNKLQNTHKNIKTNDALIIPKSINMLIKKYSIHPIFALALEAYKSSGIMFLTRSLKLLELPIIKKAALYKLEGLLPKQRYFFKFKNNYQAKIEQSSIAKVGILTGCVSNIVDRETINSTIQALRAWGFEVIVPKQQNCCGAINLHAGQKNKAADEALVNIKQFNKSVDYIVTPATGCAATLKQYDKLFNSGNEKNLALEFKNKILDITTLLLKYKPTSDLDIKPIKDKVAVHTSCTMRNILKESDSTYKLLQKIPNIRLTPLSEKPLCCGAAGLNMVKSYEYSNSLLENLLENIDINSIPKYIVSSNIGCTMHINRYLQNKLGLKAPKIIHPITLLLQQIKDY